MARHASYLQPQRLSPPPASDKPLRAPSMIKVSGNFKQKLERWAELLADSRVIVEHTSEAQAEVAITLIGEGFDRQRDPYGRKWAKKKHPDGRKVLHGETTRLRNGWHVERAGKSGWRVAPSVEYAGYHQEPRGGSRPQRAMVPTSSRGLPKPWARELAAVAIAEMRRHFGEDAAEGSKPTVKKRSKGKQTAAGIAARNVPHKVPANDNGRGGHSRRGSSRGTNLLRTLQRIRSLARKAGID